MAENLLNENSNTKWIQFSSDFVFGPEFNAPILELAPKSPISVYGKQKSLLEDELLEHSSNAHIFRISALTTTTANGKTFLEKVIDKK